MKKKIISKLLTVVVLGSMVFTMSMSAFAAQVTPQKAEAKVEVIALSEDISATTLNEISNSVYAGLVYPDGTTVPIDSVVTVEKLPSTFKSSVESYDSYAVTLSGKVVSDSADKNTSHTNASATLKMIWTDGPQWNNSIDEVSGTLDVIKGKVVSGKVRYGNGWLSGLQWTERDVGSSSSFAYYPGMIVQDPSASYGIIFEDELVSMSLKVSANILQ